MVDEEDVVVVGNGPTLLPGARGAAGRSPLPKTPPAHAEVMLDQALSHPPPGAGPLVGAVKVQDVGLEDVPDEASLAQWLQEMGVDVASWGTGSTKSVGSCWKEIKNNESGLEVWRDLSGKLLPVRTTHVLRAKVSSAKGYERGLFLLNTWQQLSSGKKKTRNCLLSEKLMTDEVPVQDHLMDVCRRALAEEMGFLEDASFELKRGRTVPNQDSAHPGNLEVERAEFIDYQVEVMQRGSYPGLVTMYHLYTVDIICRGLPEKDFNSLEFHGPDENGVRPLKYIHAWRWLEWSEIKRYLFEGSELKERKQRGCFQDEADLRAWLARQPGIDLSMWGQDHLSSVRDLYDEVERDEAHLELWGRNDGVPLMIRVVHLLDMLVVGTDQQLQKGQSEGKYLFQREKSYQDGAVITVNRHMSKKISMADILGASKRGLASKKSEFLRHAQQAVEQQFQYLEDQHFKLHRHTPPRVSEMTRSNISVEDASFGGHRFAVEESHSFKGMLTMYHKYTMEVKCRGLPTDDFVSLQVADGRINCAKSWRWMTWQESQDLLHDEAREAGRLRGSASECLGTVECRLADTTQSLERLEGAVRSDAAALPLVRELQRQLEETRRLVAAQTQQSSEEHRPRNGTDCLPPSLVHAKATESIAIVHSIKTASSLDGVSLLQSKSAPALTIRSVAPAGGALQMQPVSSGDDEEAGPRRRSRLGRFGTLLRGTKKRL
jgi:hypothetical protein